VACSINDDIPPVRALIDRLPLMLRALILVPLLAAGLDQARVSLVCGPDAQSCLDAAGSGRFGAAGTALLIGYVLAIAGAVGRMSRERGSLWIVAVAGLWAACGGQALLASALGTGALIGGGWLPLLAFAAAAGAMLALALRSVRTLIRTRVPRSFARVELVLCGTAPAVTPPLLLPAAATRGRAPPQFA
jgi:hypothetical protein